MTSPEGSARSAYRTSLTLLQRLQANNDLAGSPAPDDDPAADVNELYQRALEPVRGEFEQRTWQAFVRTAVDGRGASDTAPELGLSSAAVRQAKSRVLRRLR